MSLILLKRSRKPVGLEFGLEGLGVVVVEVLKKVSISFSVSSLTLPSDFLTHFP